MSYFVDAHCHLDLFQNIRSNVFNENKLSIKTISVTNTPSLWTPNQKLFRECDNIRVALGLHPELAIQREHEATMFRQLCSEAKYIGEIGLDGNIKEKSVRDTQLKVFRSLLNSIRKLSPKILTVHSRGAARETINELSDILKSSQHKVILHWYSGDLSELKRAENLGFFFSVNHKMLSSRNGKNIIKNLPSTRVLTETDAPFTFTDKIKTREQSLHETIQELSQIWGIDNGQTQQKVWENFKKLLHMAQSAPN